MYWQALPNTLTLSPLPGCGLAVAVGNCGCFQPDFQRQLGDIVEDKRRPDIDHLLGIVQGDCKHKAGHSLWLSDLQKVGFVVTMATCTHAQLWRESMLQMHIYHMQEHVVWLCACECVCMCMRVCVCVDYKCLVHRVCAIHSHFFTPWV